MSSRVLPWDLSSKQLTTPAFASRQVEDLNNLINHYHVWAHQMFPKSKFKDTIAVVERVCIKRAMAVRRPFCLSSIPSCALVV